MSGSTGAGNTLVLEKLVLLVPVLVALKLVAPVLVALVLVSVVQEKMVMLAPVLVALMLVAPMLVLTVGGSTGATSTIPVTRVSNGKGGWEDLIL